MALCTKCSGAHRWPVSGKGRTQVDQTVCTRPTPRASSRPAADRSRPVPGRSRLAASPQPARSRPAAGPGSGGGNAKGEGASDAKGRGGEGGGRGRAGPLGQRERKGGEGGEEGDCIGSRRRSRGIRGWRQASNGAQPRTRVRERLMLSNDPLDRRHIDCESNPHTAAIHLGSRRRAC
jgi:hypothetical protein